MELKLFTDLIAALGKVAGGLKAIVNLPKAERETMRRTLDETYRLIDTTLNMVLIRLGDILLLDAYDDFLRVAARLDNYDEWMQAERETRFFPHHTQSIKMNAAPAQSTPSRRGASTVAMLVVCCLTRCSRKPTGWNWL